MLFISLKKLTQSERLALQLLIKNYKKREITVNITKTCHNVICKAYTQKKDNKLYTMSLINYITIKFGYEFGSKHASLYLSVYRSVSVHSAAKTKYC